MECPKCGNKFYEVPPKFSEVLVYLCLALFVVLLLAIVWFRIEQYHYFILGWLPLLAGVGIYREIKAYESGLLVPVSDKLKFKKRVAIIFSIIIFLAFAWEFQNAL